MKTKINHCIAFFLPAIGPRIYLKTNTAFRRPAWPRAFRTLLLCGAAAAFWAVPGTANAALGNYPNKAVQLSANTTVTPSSVPLFTTNVTVSASTNFKGLLEANRTSGIVRVTNAHPAGIYTITVTAFNGSATATRTFTLTVTTPPRCSPVDPITFAPKADYPAGTNPRSVAVGDFNRDGVQDLAVAARASGQPPGQGQVMILLGKKPLFGQPPGTFLPPVFINVATTPNCVAAGDFNGDGIQDLVTVNSNASAQNVSILLGNGDGSFSPNIPRDFQVGSQPRSVAVGDFNGDQKQDLVVTNENSRSVSVLLGTGNGGFGVAQNFDVGTSVSGTNLFPYWVAVGDFDGPNGTGDGRPDLAVTVRSPNSRVLVLLNTTIPPCPLPGCLVSFSAHAPFIFGPGEDDPLSVAVGNFNLPEGKQDFVTANQVSHDVAILIGSGGGSFFQSPGPGFGGTSFPVSVAIGDFNRDLAQDLAVANGGSNDVGILRNLGTGGFLPATTPLGAGLSPNSVAVGDFNNDGKQDLAIANYDSNDVSILLGKCPCGEIFSENFDVPLNLPPNLPPGWVATPTGSWVTSSIAPDTIPNDAFVDDPAGISNKSLVTPDILITSASTRLCFRNYYNLESTYDGGVLEVSSPNINAGAFTDITDPAVGGSFSSGGYNATISSNYMSPIAGRRAWSGNSRQYICAVVNLGSRVNGQAIKLRFRMASDNSVSGTGWRIDTIQVSTGFACCCGGVGLPGPFGGGPVNLSTRMRVETGDNVGIGGFVITGGEPKRVLLRAIGPSLAQVGVPDALADPVLELHGPGAFATITNNNWRDTQETEIQATGIPPANDLESAIVATLDPGAYSAVLRGNNNTSGVALIEVYDLDQEALSSLANISTRAFVSTGDNIVIAGFALGNGDGEDNLIVVRGIGPSLTAVGVSNALADPTLELRDGNGVLLVANNDWQDDPAQAAELTAAGLAPTNNLESGIAANLPPGAYTALLAGLNNGTGVGLVEVYNLDATDSTIMTSSGPCVGGP
jgi:hypothetical protein